MDSQNGSLKARLCPGFLQHATPAGMQFALLLVQSLAEVLSEGSTGVVA